MKILKSEIAQKLKLLKTITPPKAMASEAGLLIRNGCIMANNLEISVISNLPTSSDEEFVLPIGAVNLIESLPDGEIEIKAKDSKVTVKSVCGRSTFSTIFPEQFPETEINQNDCTDSIILKTENFVNSISKVLYACSNVAVNNTLTGICLDSDGEKLNTVASDGYRLAWDKMDCQNNFKLIVPKAALQKLISFDLGEEIEFCRYKKTKAVFKSNEYTICARLIDGNFIDYKSIFKAEPQIQFETNRKNLFESVNRSLIASDKNISSPTILKHEAGSEKLSVIRNGSSYSFSEDISSSFENDSDLMIGFNAKYLIDCLKSAEGERISVEYSGDKKPLIFIDGDFKQIVLPVRLSERMKEAVE